MKPKDRPCLICGGEFENRSPVVTNDETGKTKVVQRRQCALCGDTEFSPEQYTAGRYRRKKGPSMKIIEVIVSPTGETTVQTKGYAGSECQQASNYLEQALGITTADCKTAEFYQPNETRQEVQQ